MSGSCDILNCEILQSGSIFDLWIHLVPWLLPLSGARLPRGYKTWFLNFMGKSWWLCRLLGQWPWWSIGLVAKLEGCVYSTVISNTTQSRSAMTICTGKGYLISSLTVFFHLVRCLWFWSQLCLENTGKYGYVVHLDKDSPLRNHHWKGRHSDGGYLLSPG